VGVEVVMVIRLEMENLVIGKGNTKRGGGEWGLGGESGMGLLGFVALACV
jgi:hypothetical protein